MRKVKIKGKRDGKNGRNETYIIGSKNVSRRQAVREVENGVYEGYHIYILNGEKYIRDNPDNSRDDNVNK